MLKIAVVTHYFPTSTDPWAGHSAYQTLRRIAQTCDVHVFRSYVTYPGPLQPKGFAEPDPNWRPPEVPVTYVPYTAVPLLSRPFNGYTIERRLLPLVREFKPNLVLNYVVYPQGFAAVRIARALGVPVVLTAIGSDLNRIADPVCGYLTRWTLRNADFVTTVSRDLAATAIKLGANPDTTQAILNGCDTDVFHPRDQEDARKQLGLPLDAEIVLYVGRLDLRKGLIELVKTIAELKSPRPKLHCYIIGDGPDESALRQAIEKNFISEAFSIVPSCMSEQVAVWMAAADLVTLPSYNEGCPNVVIEAVSSGRPVVATRVGGIPELLSPRSGRLVPPRNIMALTGAIDEVLTNKWDADEISQTHSRSWNDVAEDLLDIVDELVYPDQP